MATTTETTRPTDRPPILPASTAEIHHFFGVKNVEIFYRVWRPDTGANAVLVIAPGFNSHSGYYEWVGRQLSADRIAVYAIDHRGRGHSEGERYFVSDVSEYVDDLATIIDIAKADHPGRRVFVLGHSAGGVIACTYALDHQAEIDGLICESFAFKVPAPGFVLAGLRALSHVAPHARVVKLKNKLFSRDPAVVETMNTDPLVNGERQPAATMAALSRADIRLAADFHRITLPVLIMHGTSDKVTVPHGSEDFFDHAGATDKTLKLYDGHYHDLLNDIDKEHVLADIASWIDARTLS